MMASFSTLRLSGLVFLVSWGLEALAAVTLHQLNGTPAGWTQTGAPDASQDIVLQVALAMSNLDQLESRLASVSTPGRSTYGQYLDKDEVDALFAPSQASSDAVVSWLKSAGVTNITPSSGSVWFHTNVSTANSLLSTSFLHYTDAAGTTKLRTTKYSVPESLADHVDLISPTTFFGKTKTKRVVKRASTGSLARRELPAVCNQTTPYGDLVFQDTRTSFNIFFPECLREQYSVNGYTPLVSSGSTIGFSSFLNESAGFNDLALFEEHFGFPSQNFSVVLVNPQDGATDLPQPPANSNATDADMDVQSIVTISHPLPITEYITSGSPPTIFNPVNPAGTPSTNEPYLPYYEYLMNLTNSELPNVISNSYADEEQAVPENYAIRVCNLIGLMGLRGISVIESSGDEGVGASCLAGNSTTVRQFNPFFPGTCPYVTAVGGTVSFAPEAAWVGSSGGFSYYFKQAWYQTAAVEEYLKTISPETKEYYGPFVDFTGRAFPDVAAHSVDPDTPVFRGGLLTGSGGTSASSPITAAVIALLNDARLRAGKPTLGFLNPWIYAHGYQGFTDITLGQTEGCNGNDTQTNGPIPGAGVIPGAYWNATVGWDTTTGFGTPNFTALLEIVNGGEKAGWSF